MPFVTEELWQRLPKAASQAATPSIMVAPYPRAQAAWADPEAESCLDYVTGVVSRARSLRTGAISGVPLLQGFRLIF